MMKVSLVSILLLVGCINVGCDKGSGGQEPDAPGSVTITSPLPGLLVPNGSPVTVEGDMSDNNVLSSAKVEIRNKNSGAVLFTQTTSTGNVGFYRFLWSWTVSGVTTPFTATVKVIARDKLSNEVFKEVDITLDN